MLSEKDKLDFKKGIYEVFSTLGTDKVKYYPYIPPENDIYKENKAKKYGEPISLVCTTVGAVDSDEVENTTLKEKELFIDVPILALEQNNLNPYFMSKGKFTIEYPYQKVNVEYLIYDVLPSGLFTDFHSVVRFKCGVSKIVSL